MWGVGSGDLWDGVVSPGLRRECAGVRMSWDCVTAKLLDVFVRMHARHEKITDRISVISFFRVGVISHKYHDLIISSCQVSGE